jgi:receptor protein-tyrosine kinase
VEKLSLLPAGSKHRRATEMLASTAMAELVKEMSTRYPDRILVFDSPPLLATTEARVLASHMGQILMVVEADVTTQATVLKALETVEGCPVVLMVLNKAPRTDVGGYYGYGFYGAPS